MMEKLLKNLTEWNSLSKMVSFSCHIYMNSVLFFWVENLVF